ncbi:MAG: SUMF1/EgtB/PvdO family nonheme iron enzyme [Candidatus Latescibacterota bacterium]
MDTVRSRALGASLLAFLLLAAALPARAESRIALVIGNGAYAEGPLRNPPNDARAMGVALRQCGFAVTLHIDCDRRTMDEAIRQFGQRVQPGGVGLFYYSGHGVQVDGHNYLVPVGLELHWAEDAKYHAVDAEQVLDELGAAGSRVSIVVLDACRNNPFPKRHRSSTRGLVKMDAPTGTLLWYSARPGSEAPDGDGQYSPFTTSLVQRMLDPGQRVELVFSQVARDLTQGSAAGYPPWQEGVLTDAFYFVPPAPQLVSPAPEPITPPPPVVAQLAYLQVSVNAPGAQVYVDGALRGTAGPGQPLNLKGLQPGPLSVRVTADGFEPETTRATLVAGQWTPLVVELLPVAAVVPPASAAAPSPRPPPVAATGAGSRAGETRTFPLPGGASMEFVWIPPGMFTMGSPAWEPGRNDSELQHEVTISRGFWLGRCEVTQAQWQVVMGSNPSRFPGPSRPVETVSWSHVQEFIRKLNQAYGQTAYRLPTEAEWEYACRAGTSTPWSFGSEESRLAQYAWCDANSGGSTHDVGTKASNAWGLFDMHGNVWEWCQDWYDGYASGVARDPPGPASGSVRVLRGGSFDLVARCARSADRGGHTPVNRGGDVGCRLSRTP